MWQGLSYSDLYNLLMLGQTADGVSASVYHLTNCEFLVVVTIDPDLGQS